MTHTEHFTMLEANTLAINVQNTTNELGTHTVVSINKRNAIIPERTDSITLTLNQLRKILAQAEQDASK